MQGRQTEQVSASTSGIDTWPDEQILAALWRRQARGVATTVRPYRHSPRRRIWWRRRSLQAAVSSMSAPAAPASSPNWTRLSCRGPSSIPPEQALALIAGGAASFDRLDGAVEDDPLLAFRDIGGVNTGPGDVVIGISASGSTLCHLRGAGRSASTPCRHHRHRLQCGRTIFNHVDVAIVLPSGARVLAGSTRMGAGTARSGAQSARAAAVKLGHVRGGAWSMSSAKMPRACSPGHGAHHRCRSRRGRRDVAQGRL